MPGMYAMTMAFGLETTFTGIATIAKGITDRFLLPALRRRHTLRAADTPHRTRPRRHDRRGSGGRLALAPRRRTRTGRRSACSCCASHCGSASSSAVRSPAPRGLSPYRSSATRTTCWLARRDRRLEPPVGHRRGRTRAVRQPRLGTWPARTRASLALAWPLLDHRGVPAAVGAPLLVARPTQRLPPRPHHEAWIGSWPWMRRRNATAPPASVRPTTRRCPWPGCRRGRHRAGLRPLPPAVGAPGGPAWPWGRHRCRP